MKKKKKEKFFLFLNMAFPIPYSTQSVLFILSIAAIVIKLQYEEIPIEI